MYTFMGKKPNIFGHGNASKLRMESVGHTIEGTALSRTSKGDSHKRVIRQLQGEICGSN
jgi:hypothetical protein